MQESIARHSPDAQFGFYCVDGAAVELLKQHASANVLVIPPELFETEALRAARRRLRLNEYCWTCKPAILLHAFASIPRLEWAVWLDSDMLAFSDPGQELARYPNASVILTPHRFSLPEFAVLEPTVGRFNAGYVAFHNVPDGVAALNWWMSRCLEGCPAEPTEDRYADQKYLNAIPGMFPNAVISDSLGLNCAPWNVFNKKIESSNGQITVEGDPLLLYHFQGLKIIRDWAFDLYGGPERLPKMARELIYAPYVDALALRVRQAARKIGEPWAGIDRDFVGHGGLIIAARRIRRCPNLVIKW